MDTRISVRGEKRVRLDGPEEAGFEESARGVKTSGSKARLFERLSQLPGYTWDQAVEPFHSTYNHWHISGLCPPDLVP
jgi:hypothetical protein